jgi:hypothetical protein
MSSKMLAGVVAGGFGVVFYIALVLSANFSGLLAFILAMFLLFGLGVLAGALSAAWLELDDYGEQASSGALSGLVAAGIVEACDLLLRLLLAAVGKPNPTNLLSNLLTSRLPNINQAAYLFLVVVVNLLLYLIYLLIMVGMSGLSASILGRAKDAEALQAIVAANDPVILSTTPAETDEEMVDPALWPYQRPEYSPFVSDTAPPPPLPLWQQRRLEREAQSAERQPPSGRLPVQGSTSGQGAMGNLAQNQQRPSPQSGLSGNPQSAYQRRLPADGQRPKPRGRERDNG